jgi:hypothetical protein
MASKKRKYTKSMLDKTKVHVDPAENSFGRKVVGMGFALVGFLLILGVIILNIISNVEPKLDEELGVPKLDEIVAHTNKDKITISGKVEDAEQVIIYVNDDMIRQVVSVEDEKFSYEYEIPEEGEYVFRAVSVEGFPFRRGSEKSDKVKVLVDWTAPSADVALEYESEVEGGLVTVTGEVEPEIFVRLLGEEDVVYETESDEEGFFEIEDVRLSEGENEFRVELQDKAGNRNVLARRVTVTSPVDAPPEGDIPEASGDLSKALGMLMNNRMMTVFGLLALFALLANSGLVLLKTKKQD